MAEDEVITFGDKCPTCNCEVWTTDEYDDMEDPITFCSMQCPHDGELLSERED